MIGVKIFVTEMGYALSPFVQLYNNNIVHVPDEWCYYKLLHLMC